MYCDHCKLCSKRVLALGRRTRRSENRKRRNERKKEVKREREERSVVVVP